MVEKDRNILDKPEDNKNSDNNWKWGIFYYNPNDKRIFPRKRYGNGWTINFANPLSIGAFLILLIGGIILAEKLKK